ncbi:hypothetical protein CEXT_617341 [Caerostris extrusa]|uniref:Uncharacterized protein n=1 Tax=Caerostris extrusa TaxID=172846 RepID=A0AAV4UGG2_CAEEX|nr:hypothetical protein CEXT_617341 [Caerostris extrusa]
MYLRDRPKINEMYLQNRAKISDMYLQGRSKIDEKYLQDSPMITSGKESGCFFTSRHSLLPRHLPRLELFFREKLEKKPYLSSHFGKYVPREVNAPTGNEILAGLIRETTYSLRSLYGWVVGVKCSPSRYVSKGQIAE